MSPMSDWLVGSSASLPRTGSIALTGLRVAAVTRPYRPLFLR